MTLTVNDGNGGIATDSTTATVAEVNDPPVADAGGPYNSVTGAAITFDGSGSSDYDNQDGTAANDQALSYTWDFGDGTPPVTVATPTVTHTYAEEETYAVALTVSDGELVSDPSTTTATVTQAQAEWTIDDGDPGYLEWWGNWTIVTGDGGNPGLDGVPDYRLRNESNADADWQFDGLAPGTYEVLVSWVAQSDGARRVPYNIHDGLNVLESVTVNQRNSPAGPDGFESLGEYYISSGLLRVYLEPGRIKGSVVADAVRVVPVVSGASAAAQSTAATDPALAADSGSLSPTRADLALLAWFDADSSKDDRPNLLTTQTADELAMLLVE